MDDDEAPRKWAYVRDVRRRSCFRYKAWSALMLRAANLLFLFTSLDSVYTPLSHTHIHSIMVQKAVLVTGGAGYIGNATHDTRTI